MLFKQEEKLEWPDNPRAMKAYDLAKEIARKIEAELDYPGQIKVNIIREVRSVDYAT